VKILSTEEVRLVVEAITISATKEYFCRRDLSVLRKLVKTISSDLRSPIDVDADIHLILRKVRA
jgi:hypothetical protein